MKKTFVLAAIIAVFSLNSTLFAQSRNDSTNWKDITLGPLIMPGASTNAGNVATGGKSQTMLFSWSAGLVSCFPLTPNFAIQLSACYDSRGVGFYDPANSDNFANYKFNYFSIRPELRLGAFLIGLGIGIPVGADTTSGGNVHPTTVGSTNMNLLLEARVGATSPLFTAENGSVLRFLISASYGLTQIIDNSSDQGQSLQPSFGVNDKTKYNGPFGTIQLGFAYEFNLSPHS
jgi:hypothetical protein